MSLIRLQELSEGFETIDSKTLYDELLESFPLPNVQMYMRDLAETGTTTVYFATTGFQIDWYGRDKYLVL
jgi:hypothetical protein